MPKIIKSISESAERPWYFVDALENAKREAKKRTGRDNSWSIYKLETHDYLCLTDDCQLFGLDNRWDYWEATRYEVDMEKVVNPKIIFRVIIGAQESHTTAEAKTKKELMTGIEDGSLAWHTATEEEIRRDAEIEKAIADSIQIKITVGEEEIAEEKPRKPASIKDGLAPKTAEQARPKIRRSRGVKRVGAALLLALIGIFTPGMSLLIVPLLISGSESVLKEQSSLGHKAMESSMAWVLLGAGIICGLIGIFSPVFSFLCAIFICQSYNMRCKDMYARMNK